MIVDQLQEPVRVIAIIVVIVIRRWQVQLASQPIANALAVCCIGLLPSLLDDIQRGAVFDDTGGLGCSANAGKVIDLGGNLRKIALEPGRQIGSSTGTTVSSANSRVDCSNISRSRATTGAIS